MTLEELKNKWELSSYNEGKTEQLDYYINLRKKNIGDVAYLYWHEYNDLAEMEIINIIARSDDPKYYDELLEDDDVLIKGEEKYNAETSAEFITDYDCYLVWFRYSPKYNWVIASCDTSADGVNIYRFRGTVQEVKEKIVSMVMGDAEDDMENYEYGTEAADRVQFVGGEMVLEFYGYGCYSDYHIDYTAREVRSIQSI